MKKILRFVAAGTLTVFVLAACQAEPVAEVPPQTQQPSAAEPSVKKVEIPAVSVADQTAFDAALNLLDASFCQKMTDPAGVTACETAVGDAKISAAAAEKMDATLCAGISTEESRKACQIQIDYLKAQLAKEEQFQAENEKVNQMISGRDLTACQSITDENMRAGCEFNILINEGSVKGDGATVCVKASSEDTKTRCLEYYDSLPETVEQPDIAKE